MAVDEKSAADEGDEDHDGYNTDDELDCSGDEAHLVVSCLDSFGGYVVKGGRWFDFKELVTRIVKDEFRDRCL